MEDKNVNNIEPNRKPHIFNRIISGVIDICLVFMSFYFLYSAFLESSISEPMFKYVNILIEVQDQAKVESGYGYKVYEYESDTTNQIYTEEDGRTYIVKTIELSENYTEEEKNDSANVGWGNLSFIKENIGLADDDFILGTNNHDKEGVLRCAKDKRKSDKQVGALQRVFNRRPQDGYSEGWKLFKGPFSSLY